MIQSMKLIEHECVVTDMNFTCDSTTCFGCNTKNPNLLSHSLILTHLDPICHLCYKKT